MDSIIYNVVLPDPPPKIYKCNHENCDKAFSKLSRLKMHVNCHLSEKPFKCSFEGCKSAYYHKNHLKRHEATRHLTPGGTYVCAFDGCVASFSSSLSLYYHSKRKHGLKKHACSYCDKTFSKKYQLKEHEYSHTGNKTFKCSKCLETFSTHANFKTHQKAHTKQPIGENKDTQSLELSYKCKKCDEEFTKWSNFVAHRKTHPAVTAQKVACHVCQKIISRSSLNSHLKVHEDSNEKVAHFCTYEGCLRFYHHTKNLNHHIRHAHEGHFYECKICNQKLSTKQKLEQHIKIQHENPPKVKNSKKFSREKLLEMLCGEPTFDVKRRGPSVGTKYKNQTPIEASILLETNSSLSNSENSSDDETSKVSKIFPKEPNLLEAVTVS